MNKIEKRIVFIAPPSGGGPSVLYQGLVELLNKKIPGCSFFFVSSSKEWLGLHFINKKYDIIISSLPFLWKPPHCIYIIHQHGLYRTDRGFTSIPRLLNWLYPYNIRFSKIILYPSEFLKKYYNSTHKDQRVIYNLSSFPLIDKKEIKLGEKKEIIMTTVTGFSFYDKARGIFDIFEKLENIDLDKKIHYYICGDGKYIHTIQEKITRYHLSDNITIVFLGKLDKKALMSLLNKTDIFLYSTFQDTFGISIIDAMAFGIPVLLNDYELFNELYDHEFIVHDEQEFSDKVKKLIYDNEYYLSYTNKIYNNFERFDEETIISQWKHLIQSIS